VAVISSILSKTFIPVFFEHPTRLAEHKKIDVFMFTPGGEGLRQIVPVSVESAAGCKLNSLLGKNRAWHYAHN
jgi:hypothetical protein